ncbi:hypothetical protein TIFTF001_056117, partial [Ficus carica]
MLTNDKLYAKNKNPVSSLVHGLSWTGLAAPTTPWLRAKGSNSWFRWLFMQREQAPEEKEDVVSCRLATKAGLN